MLLPWDQAWFGTQRSRSPLLETPPAPSLRFQRPACGRHMHQAPFPRSERFRQRPPAATLRTPAARLRVREAENSNVSGGQRG